MLTLLASYHYVESSDRVGDWLQSVERAKEAKHNMKRGKGAKHHKQPNKGSRVLRRNGCKVPSIEDYIHTECFRT